MTDLTVVFMAENLRVIDVEDSVNIRYLPRVGENIVLQTSFAGRVTAVTHDYKENEIVVTVQRHTPGIIVKVES